MKQRGFTLIEILVVTFILAVMIGLVALRLTRDDRDLVRDEAERLVLLLQAAREEAILRGSLLALEMGPADYRFLRLDFPRLDDKGKFVPIADAPLTPRRLPERMDVRLELEGQLNTKSQVIVLDPSGVLPIFRIVFTLNDTRWWVLGQQDGIIRSAATADAHAS